MTQHIRGAADGNPLLSVTDRRSNGTPSWNWGRSGPKKEHDSQKAILWCAKQPDSPSNTINVGMLLVRASFDQTKQ
eukprot:scaffold283515_cov18-Tisochrysis_lutea.AAC.1